MTISRHLASAASICAAFLLCLFVPAPVHAQTASTAAPENSIEPDRFTVTAFLGPGFGGGLQSNALDLGVAAGYNLTTRVGVEGEFGFARTGSNTLINVSSNTETYSANALYHFPIGSRWLPYGTFGIGAMHGGASVSAPGVEIGQSSTDFQFNLGGGVKTRLSNAVKFRADLRFFDGGNLPNFWRVYGGLLFLPGSR